MAPHWPEEVDVFSEPHSRMKKLVHKYSKMVSTTDFTDENHMTTLLENLIYVFSEFKAHEHIENILIMRSLKRKMKAACVTSAAVCNCHSDNRLKDMLDMVVHGSRSRWTEKSVNERQSYGHKLQKALEDFTKNFLPHMEEEEEVFQPMLMQYFSYEELKELKAKVIHEHLVSTKQEKYVEDLWQKTAKTKQEPCYFNRLPDEICEKVFSYLNPQDLCRSAQTCHRWNGLTKDPSLWHGIYPVHWAEGNWTFHPEPLGGVDGAGELNEELMQEFDPPVLCHDEDADVDESSLHYYNDADDKDCYGDEGVNPRVLAEVKILSSIVKHLLPQVGSGVRVVDLAYSKGLNNSLVHKILKLCPNVEVLDLTHTQVGDDAFYEYGVSNRQSKLRHLDLTNCQAITDQTLYSLIGAAFGDGIQNTLDVEQINYDKMQAVAETDIEIIPACCQKKQHGKKCCNRADSNLVPITVKEAVNLEKGTNGCCSGKDISRVDSSVIQVFGETCAGRQKTSKTCDCDFIIGDCKVNGKNTKLLSHPHKLSIERDACQAHFDTSYVTMSSSNDNSFCECEVLHHKSEDMLLVKKQDKLTCCQTNSKASLQHSPDNKANSFEMHCCKDKSSDDDYHHGTSVCSSHDDGCRCALSVSSSCACPGKVPNSQLDMDAYSCSSSTVYPSFMSSSSSCPSSLSDNNQNGSECVGYDHNLLLEHDKSSVTDRTRPSTDQLSQSHFIESQVGISFQTDNISKPCCKSRRTFTSMSSGLANTCDKDEVNLSRRQSRMRTTGPLFHLQYLSFNGCYGISDVGLRVLSRYGGTPQLKHLDLSGCVQLTGTSVEQLVSTCGPQFDHANLFYCDNIPVDPYPSTASGCRNRGCGTRFCCSAD